MAVIGLGFTGLYVDANAISPGRANRIGAALEAVGIDFVDGGIIGGPAWEPGRTWLYLSGAQAARAADLFTKGPLETCVIGPEPGTASALKMCYAAYSKGTSALLSAVMAAAEELQVRELLESEWSRGGSNFAEESRNRVRRVTKKAWRFEGELEEIAATFEEAGLPGGFHHAGAEIYRRMAGFKGWGELPGLEAVLDALVRPKG
jgi:3-hydroxyisobutyrate dehydrogenase-like beta-hydroxyacid dehydrogenase